MSASTSGIMGGQPSTTQPIATPWLSPKVVTRNMWPNVLKDIAARRLGSRVWERAGRRGSTPQPPRRRRAGLTELLQPPVPEHVDGALLDVEFGGARRRLQAE